MQNLKAVMMGMVTARALLGSNKPNPAIWLGWAYFTRKVYPPLRGGVNFDLLVIFCACSFYVKCKILQVVP